MLFFFILSILALFYYSTVRLAKISTIADCFENGTAFVEDKYGVKRSGQAFLLPKGVNLSDINFSAGTRRFPSNSEDFVCIIQLFSTRKSTIKHEICHCKQFKEMRINECTDLQVVFNNELECYIKQRIPFIYANEIKELQSQENIK